MLFGFVCPPLFTTLRCFDCLQRCAAGAGCCAAVRVFRLSDSGSLAHRARRAYGEFKRRQAKLKYLHSSKTPTHSTQRYKQKHLKRNAGSALTFPQATEYRFSQPAHTIAANAPASAHASSWFFPKSHAVHVAFQVRS